jgi:hypothetical protein
MMGQICLVAIRDIDVGEPICFDYAMTESEPDYEFTCLCGTDRCRGRLTGNDWQLSELRERYGSHFSPYLLRRSQQLDAAENP